MVTETLRIKKAMKCMTFFEILKYERLSLPIMKVVRDFY